MRKQRAWVMLIGCTLAVHSGDAALSSPTGQARSAVEKIIIDTDIGGDIDDAFAVALALQCPEFEIVGITTAWGDTTLRARLLTRLLKETGHAEIPVAVGIVKHPAGKQDTLTQARYAEATPAGQNYPNAVEFLLEKIREYPGEITLIGIGPETNIGAAIDRDAATFRKLKRVVIMGGSVDRGYDNDKGVNSEPSAEYNIAMDPAAAQKLFASGVPLYVMPLDSTQIKLQVTRRAQLVSAGTPVTDQMTLLYCQWSPGCSGTPTLFDPVAVAYAMRPDLCSTKAMRLRVDDQGYTRVESGEPNVRVCLSSDAERLLDFLMPRLVGPPVGKPKP
jgi:purine nucleosidase